MYASCFSVAFAISLSGNPPGRIKLNTIYPGQSYCAILKLCALVKIAINRVFLVWKDKILFVCFIVFGESARITEHLSGKSALSLCGPSDNKTFIGYSLFHRLCLLPGTRRGGFGNPSCGGFSFWSHSLPILIARFRWGWPPLLFPGTKLVIIF